MCALQQEKSPQWEAHAPELESSPHLVQLEKACMQQQRPSTAKIDKYQCYTSLKYEVLETWGMWGAYHIARDTDVTQ